ncbi:28S ribosomal protein S14, mitochondrial [Halocaridina rubra]|uniref:28S ribosomal protein S14, mitochondrial n=1 Tax=Halocaridina rubra TaxID=373956 RepID=A0AAN8XA76_HALRR
MAAPLRGLFTSGWLNKIRLPVTIYPQVPVCDIHTSAPLDKYANWKMVKEVRNRKIVKEFAFERLNINAIRKAEKILPPALKEAADQEIHALPRNSSIVMLHKRCAVTSRPRGLVTRWRLSRIVWRNEADYNKLSGVQRAMW